MSDPYITIYVILNIFLVPLTMVLFGWLANRFDKPKKKWQSLGAFIGFILSVIFIIVLMLSCVFCM